MPQLFGSKIEGRQHPGIRIETRLGGKGRGLLLFEQASGDWPSEMEIRQAIAQNSDVERYLKAKGKTSDGGVWAIPARCYVGEDEKTFDLEITPVVFVAPAGADPASQVMDLIKVAQAQLGAMVQAGQQQLALMVQAGTQHVAAVSQAASQTASTQAQALAELAKHTAEAQSSICKLLEAQTTAATKMAEVSTAAFEKQTERVQELQEREGDSKLMNTALTLFAPVVVDRLRAMPDKKPEPGPAAPATATAPAPAAADAAAPATGEV